MKHHFKEAVELLDRGLDKNIRISVTGLSGSGKTAFITSLVNQLLHHKSSRTLPFWLAKTNGRILAVKIVPYQDLHIPEFPYHESIKQIEDKQQWPESTKNISQIRISIKYQVKNKWVKKIQPNSYLNIDLVDYPGEWLLDLPLLSMNYQQWSRSYYQWLDQSPQRTLASEFSSKIDLFDSCSLYQEGAIKNISHVFREFLISAKSDQRGIHFIQPGRFVLPGDLDGAPVLDFFPLIDERANTTSGSNIEILEQRFNYYRDQIVKPFFKEYFDKVDRQLVLVDCLKTLNQGYASYKDLQHTLNNLITSFNYGQSNWFKRMFRPKINKVIIAASKSDHVPPDQQNSLRTFLSNMLHNAENQVGYEGVDVTNLIFSSIVSTEAVYTDHKGQNLCCTKGLELISKNKVVNYPGKIPTNPMTKSQWNEHEFDFIDFALPHLSANEALPHQRMDQIIEQLIGDKLL